MTTPFVAHCLWHDALDSTQTTARAAANAGASAGTTIVAFAQRRGRGRGDNAWASPSGGIYLTCILRPGVQRALPSLSPALALALTALGPAVGLPPLGVKWPNDLVGRRGKVGGLLLEQATDVHGAPFVLVGLGINVETPALPASPPSTQPPVPPSSLRAEGAAPARVADRRALAAATVALVGHGADAWERDGFGPSLAAYDRAHAWHGRKVVAHGGGPAGEDVAGTVAGIAADGALALATAAGPVLIRSATLRLAAPAE